MDYIFVLRSDTRAKHRVEQHSVRGLWLISKTSQKSLKEMLYPRELQDFSKDKQHNQVVTRWLQVEKVCIITS